MAYLLNPVKLEKGNTLLSSNKKLNLYNLTLFTKKKKTNPTPFSYATHYHGNLSRQNASFSFEENIGWSSRPNPSDLSPFAKNRVI